MFDIHGLEVTLGGQLVLGPLDLEVARGAFLGILGPNGSGKTTLLRALTGGVKPSAGEVRLEGRPLRDYRALELARLVGVVPQQFNLDFSFTVEEMVAMGRYAHGGRKPTASNDARDARAAESADGGQRMAAAATPTLPPWPPRSPRPGSPPWRAGSSPSSPGASASEPSSLRPWLRRRPSSSSTNRSTTST